MNPTTAFSATAVSAASGRQSPTPFHTAAIGHRHPEEPLRYDLTDATVEALPIRELPGFNLVSVELVNGIRLRGPWRGTPTDTTIAPFTGINHFVSCKHEHIRRPMRPQAQDRFNKQLADKCEQIIRTPQFQRIYNISQGIGCLLPSSQLEVNRGAHSKNMAHLAWGLAASTGLSSKETTLIVVGSLLHDIGHTVASHSGEEALAQIKHHRALYLGQDRGHFDLSGIACDHDLTVLSIILGPLAEIIDRNKVADVSALDLALLLADSVEQVIGLPAYRAYKGASPAIDRTIYNSYTPLRSALKDVLDRTDYLPKDTGRLGLETSLQMEMAQAASRLFEVAMFGTVEGGRDRCFGFKQSAFFAETTPPLPFTLAGGRIEVMRKGGSSLVSRAMSDCLTLGMANGLRNGELQLSDLHDPARGSDASIIGTLGEPFTDILGEKRFTSAYAGAGYLSWSNFTEVGRGKLRGHNGELAALIRSEAQKSEDPVVRALYDVRPHRFKGHICPPVLFGIQSSFDRSEPVRIATTPDNRAPGAMKFANLDLRIESGVDPATMGMAIYVPVYGAEAQSLATGKAIQFAEHVLKEHRLIEGTASFTSDGVKFF